MAEFLTAMFIGSLLAGNYKPRLGSIGILVGFGVIGALLLFGVSFVLSVAFGVVLMALIS